MYKLGFGKRTSGRYLAKEFLDNLETRDRDSFDKFHRAFQKFLEGGPEAVTGGIYKSLKNQPGLVQFTIWKYRILGFREGNQIFLTNGFKKDQDDTPPTEITRAHDIRAEHKQQFGGGKK